jgi:hypothetical protein
MSDELLNHADQALYCAKQEARVVTRPYRPPVQRDGAFRRLALRRCCKAAGVH